MLIDVIKKIISQATLAKKFLPLLDRVLVLRSEAITKTASGIVIPEKAQAKVLQATVVAVGPGSRNKVRQFISIQSKR